MAGLLNFDDPQSQALIGMGMGLLGASGPSATPVSLGQALGQGWQSGQQSYENAIQGQFRKAQMDEFKRKQLVEQQRQAALKEFAATLPQEQQQQFILDPEGFIKRMNEEYTLSPGAKRFGANGKLIASVPDNAPPKIQNFINGDKEEQRQWNAETGKWEVLGSGPRWSPTSQQAPAPYFTVVPTENGLGKFNNRTGQFELIGGGGVVKPADSPTVQGNIAEAKETGKTRSEAIANLPKAITNGEEALRQVDQLLKHPGFKQAVGGSSMLGVQKIPGTAAKDFMVRLDQIKGGAFLTAFETLKGSGQITEVEGAKATAALARMDNATSEPEFVSAVRDYERVIRNAVNNAKMRAGKRGGISSQPNPEAEDPLGIR